MSSRQCRKQGCRDRDGNCVIPGSDELPVQCVGSWVEDKYFFLERYLDATREVRKKFLEKGNAVFIDLYAGPGKCIVRNEKREIDSGGIRALKIDKVPFNEYYYFDISNSNVEALKKRISKNNKHRVCHVRCGDSNVEVYNLVRELLKQRYRYHFAFIDPFGPEGLKFHTLRELAKLDRMDMLIHFPIGSIKRNLQKWINSTSTILDDFLGTDIWRQAIQGKSNTQITNILIDIFKEQFKSIGYPEEGLRMASSNKDIYAGLPSVPVKNTKNIELYVLILASKHSLAQKIWHSLLKYSPDGQKSFL